MPHISTTAKATPDKPAFIMADSGQVVTYSQLDASSNRIAHLFRSLGLKRYDHIALLMENRPEFLEITQGGLRSGVIFTPMSNHLQLEEARYILQNCNAKVFITETKFQAMAKQLLEEIPQLEHCFFVDGDASDKQNWCSALALQATTPIDDECMGIPMLYSSGTTGQPKGVLNKQPFDSIHEIHPSMQALGAVFGMDENMVYLSSAPLYHAAPLHYNMLTLQLGGTSVIMDHFDAERALQCIEQYQVSHSQWVPIMFIRMLKMPETVRSKYDVSSLKMAIHAAAPCPIEIKQQMIDWWGPVITEYYSGSEGNGMTMIDSHNWLTHKGSVGPALVGDIFILDDVGNELPRGETGAVYFGNGNEFEYHGEQEKTANAFNDKGWSTLGDVGYLDDDGFLYLTDRQHFMIISGGVNIYPQEIENLLITHKKVSDVAVFGVANDEFGEEVKAVVQPVEWDTAGDELASELIDWARAQLSHVKVPRSIDFKQELPRGDNGKLYKRILIDEYK
ncbi:acyl-CoA synthetase [Paraglaciecola sp. 20A4]|uniref:acyl-CoA synthetase n=1 Tax=Paraglaciecola sp. 20A4 TaxID=2687288 RepID=UPI00140E37EB|nr:acyl-CoA synthetase [Paraglaciecola sp. 20A4]